MQQESSFLYAAVARVPIDASYQLVSDSKYYSEGDITNDSSPCHHRTPHGWLTRGS